MNFVRTLLRINHTKGVACLSRLLHVENGSTNVPPSIISLNANNHWIWQKNNQIGLPIVPLSKIGVPNLLRWVPPLIEPPKTEDALEAPSNVNRDDRMEAARMIIIRRKKMKKHKLKKLRKKMRFVWAKVRQRRELKKEKLFQSVLIQQCKEAEAFSAKAYVQERIDKWKAATTPPVVQKKKRSYLLNLPPTTN